MPKEGKINFYLSPHSRQTLATKAKPKGSSSDSLNPSDQSDYEPKRHNHCDIIIDITNSNTNRKTQRNDQSTDHPFVRANKGGGGGSNDSSPGSGKKYHSALNRIRNESIIGRSKSFQEQGVKPIMRNSRFFVRRQRKSNASDEFSSDTVSHQNIEITVEDTDQTPLADCTGWHRLHGDYGMCGQITPERNRRGSKDQTRTPPKAASPAPSYELTNYNEVKPWGSGHILGRIFRRMRKISIGWRKSRCKVRRGDWDFLCFFSILFFRFLFP